jgi:hypothetical protein
MLRNPNEVDRLGSMNYWATGTIMSAGQSCKVGGLQGERFRRSAPTISATSDEDQYLQPVCDLPGARHAEGRGEAMGVFL